MIARCLAYVQLMRWHSPMGILLLLAPVCWALLVAFGGQVPLMLWVVFVLGVWCSRSLGCVINDICDRHIDAQVARTKSRPLADGRLTVKQAWVVALCLTGVCLVLLWQLPLRLWFHGVIAAVLLCVYPLMKRVFVLPQLVLAVAFSWAIVIIFALADTRLAWWQLPTSPACWLLFCANCAWVMAYDTQYAMMDLADDSKIGVQSSARLFNKSQHAITSCLLMLFVLCLYIVNRQVLWNQQLFLLLLGVVALWLFYLLRFTRGATDPNVYKRAFKHHAAIGLFIACGMAISYAS